MKKGINVYACVYGAEFIEAWSGAPLKSLLQGSNRDALDGANWILVTRKGDQPIVDRVIKNCGLKIGRVDYICFGEEFDNNPHASGAYLKEAWMQALGMSITYNRRIVMCPPDTIFGDGSIPNIIELGQDRDTVVFAAHVRVNPSIVEAIEYPIENHELVNLSWQHLHKSWADAEIGAEKINTYIGGVCWRWVQGGFVVQHQLPTPYVINPVPEDVVYFRNQIHFGVIDHGWPGEMLIDSGRQRMIGSSDVAFMAEITKPESNVPPLGFYREDEPDQFWRNAKHNRHNKMFYVHFRGS